jgi:hypothetical protein
MHSKSCVHVLADADKNPLLRGGGRIPKAAVQAEQRAAELEKLVKHLRLRTERGEKTAKAATAETSALFSGD